MDKVEQLHKAKALLHQALIAASNSMPNNRDVAEAKSNIRKAMERLDEASKSQIRKSKANSGQFEQWWGSVQSGVANASFAPMTKEATMKSLKELDDMIAEQQKILDDLQIQAQTITQSSSHELLSD